MHGQPHIRLTLILSNTTLVYFNSSFIRLFGGIPEDGLYTDRNIYHAFKGKRFKTGLRCVRLSKHCLFSNERNGMASIKIGKWHRNSQAISFPIMKTCKANVMQGVQYV